MKRLIAAAVLACAPAATAQTPGPFTAAQAGAGQTVYLTSCAPCHQKSLQGSGEAPPLTGPAFIAGWGKRGAKELFGIIKASMPLGRPDSLGDETYLAITAFILQANGTPPGSAALTAASTVRIGSVADGKMPPALAQGLTAAQARPATAAARKLPMGLLTAGTVEHYTPVTDAMLTHPADADWLMHLRTYAGWSYSPLAQITPANAQNLQLKWVWAMSEGGRQQMNPLVHDGVMFLSNNSDNRVEALDARTGTLIWQNRLGPVQDNVANANRSMALWENLLIYPGTDAKLTALDARSGKLVWQTAISTLGNRIGGIMVVRGKVLVGLTRCDDRPAKEHCFIGAWDAATGKSLWKFTTVALKGQPGGDSWNNIDDAMRSGGDAWIAGTYDPASNTTYWGTGQAKPWMRSARGTGAGANDYTNSTLALDADSGKLKWWKNHAPGESLDLDEVFERTLVEHDGRKELITVGKTGIMWKFDRETGKYIDHAETVFQNVYAKIDRKTGTPTYRADIINQKPGEQFGACPSPQGGHDWAATSYDPANDLILVPLSQSCFMFNGSSQRVFESPGSDGNLGRLSAYHAGDLKPAWSFQQRTPFLTGVMTTAGGVAFVGDYDRTFRALDTRTGETVWQTRLATSVQGYPVSFSVDGQQYVAVTTGTQGGSPVGKPTTMLKGEITRPSNGQAVYVFALPKKEK